MAGNNFVIGVDLGGTNIRAGLADAKGGIISRDKRPTEADREAAVTIDNIAESVKAAADFYAPVTGEVVEVNEALLDQPELLNQDPYGEGGMFKIKMSDEGELANLMDPAAYCAHVEAEHQDH